MRIALDVRYRTGSGASHYVHNLLSALRKQNTKYDFVVVRFAAQSSLDDARSSEPIICPEWGPAGQVIWDQLFLPRILRRRRIDLYHALKMLGPYSAPCPQVRVLHSITNPYRGVFPTTKARAFYWNVLGKRIFRGSARLIAVSEFLRDFGRDVLAVPEGRISVIYNGLTEEFARAAHGSDRGPESGTDAPFLLSVGNVVPVKNHLTAVRAFHKVAQRHPEYRLVIAGGTAHPYFRDVKAAVERLGLASKVQFLGYVEKDELIRLYRRATVLVMPSLTEGFGLSALEAMGCGLPVIGSGSGALPEVGDGAIRIVDDPVDIDGWASAILELIEDASLRERMRTASLDRAKAFSWNKAARQTLALYGELLGTKAAEDAPSGP